MTVIRTERSLYLDPLQVKIERPEQLNTLAIEKYPDILGHQIAGLKQMGCHVEFHETHWLSVNQGQPDVPFLNRIMNVKCLNIAEVMEMCFNSDNLSCEINPFSTPYGLETELVENRFRLKLVSDVLGKVATGFGELPDLPFKVERVQDERTIDLAFGIFSSFFVKDGESPDSARRRFTDNTRKGPHFVVLNGETPIATAGAICFNGVASVYEGIVEPAYRSGPPIALRMAMEVENALLDDNVSFLYYKSRNRVVIYGAKAFLGMRHLYNEMVYEKN